MVGKQTQRIFLCILRVVAVLIWPAGAGSAAFADPTTIIDRIVIEAPTTKSDGTGWDVGMAGLVRPDMLICIESPHVPPMCSDPFSDATTASCPNAYVCEASFRVMLESSIDVTVSDQDLAVHDPMLQTRIQNPGRCGQGCWVDSAHGRFRVRVLLDEVDPYLGPYRDRAGSSPSTSQPNASSRRPSAAEIELALMDLRDVDNCVGRDQHIRLPVGTVLGVAQNAQMGPDSLQRMLDLAAMLAAVPERSEARQQLLASARRLMPPGDFLFFESIVLPDAQAGRDFENGMDTLVRYFATELVTRGLSRYLPIPPIFTRSGSLGDILERQITGNLHGRVSDDVVGWLWQSHGNVTPECVMNELMKREYIALSTG